MEEIRAIIEKLRRARRRGSIQYRITISFTLVAVGSLVAIGVLLYAQFATNLRQTILRENRQLVDQIAMNVNSYTAGMRGISDAMYYNVIKNADLEEQSLNQEMGLLYEANNASLVSIACYAEDGALVAAAPNASAKPNVNVTGQEWFVQAFSVIENPHFSTPYVQNLFEDFSRRYNRVVSLSRMVELTRGGATSRGVLLVDMNYSGLEMIFRQMGRQGEGYVYLIDAAGEIIYHPRQNLIVGGLFIENNRAAAQYTDGVYEEEFAGAGRQVIVKTVSYTGWKIVSVIPNSEFAVTTSQMRLLVVVIVGLAIFLLIMLNTFVSSRIANPLKRLDKSVKELDAGNLNADIYIGGSYEVEHLGKTIRSTVQQMRALMDDVVTEQENKRKSEFDALQAQINPHFLYNTLDSIVWMIESGQNQEAISMVTALANLFRIALSKGEAIIPIGTELRHASYYLYIQNIRYKDKFTVKTQVDPEIENCMTIKLVLQPLLENAVYHAMEMMDGDGEITIRGYRQGDDVVLEVADNGLGMSQEQVDGLLSGQTKGSKRGSGIGLRNVHQRIRLYCGEGYGVTIESQLDKGTTVRLRMLRMLPGQPPGGQNAPGGEGTP